MNTQFPSENNIVHAWHVLDAANIPVGRVASRAAMLLMGKHKAIYTPFIDTGDHVIILNAAKVRLTGRKEEQKIYRRHSGYQGGLTEITARTQRARRPAALLEDAIAGMLPKTKLGKHMVRKLRVYAGDKHPHQAQMPVAIALANK
ncbi:MAG TPA: 50S ribosomal protein L13 [Bryobacteraceae bacterium]